MPRRKPLSTILWEDLSSKIASGQLQPGVQLPTEAELGEEYQVSRTVVREAIARLRSDGLVIPQQGRGMFVSEAPAQRFQISEEDLQTLPETIALLELRMSVEVEAAGFCAERRSEAEAREIRRLMEQVDARHEDPSAVEIHYDYDFHLKIARTARNEFMLAFLEYLRPFIVPRFQLARVVTDEMKGVYYDRIHAEHEAIVQAIEQGDPARARMVMRDHLANSLDRIRAFAAKSGAAERPAGTQAVNAILSRLAAGLKP